MKNLLKWHLIKLSKIRLFQAGKMHKQVRYSVEDFRNILKSQLMVVLKTFVQLKSITTMLRLTKYGQLVVKQVGIMETGFGRSEVF